MGWSAVFVLVKPEKGRRCQLFFLATLLVSGAGGFREVALRVHNDTRVRLDLAPLQFDSGVTQLTIRNEAYDETDG